MVPEKYKEMFRKAVSLETLPRTQRDEAVEAESFLAEEGTRIVEKYCVTPAQRKWMNERNLSVESMCEGRYAIGDSAEVHKFYKDWNEKLGAKWFDEEDSMQGMWDAISDTFGNMGVESVQFGDSDPVSLGGTIEERFGEKNDDVANEVIRLVQQTKARLK